jgi:hypothetical protein
MLAFFHARALSSSFSVCFAPSLVVQEPYTRKVEPRVIAIWYPGVEQLFRGLTIESARRESCTSSAPASRVRRAWVTGIWSRPSFHAAVALVFILCLAAPSEVWLASGPIPGEDRVGFFYTLTHLHAAAYVVLFFIFLLSLANLLFQYGSDVFLKPITFVLSLLRKSSYQAARPVLRGLKQSSLNGGEPTRQKRHLSRGRHATEGSEAVGQVRKATSSGAYAKPPTPLDGVNHSIPQFPSRTAPAAGAPRVSSGKPETKAPMEFKFSSAVGVPSREEVERREKTQLVVSGAVLGPDGKGMSSVIVYLTDTAGNRVGQSCRSLPETGEFKVLIGEPGQYVLRGYKRGFVMENAEPVLLPIESGKIEGYNFRMIPEGCLVSGKVRASGTGEDLAGYVVTCACETGESVRSGITDSAGQFRIQGVPAKSECHLELSDKAGNLLLRSSSFRAVPNKEHYVEIQAPRREGPPKDEPHESASGESAEPGRSDGGDVDSTTSGDAPSSPGSKRPRGPEAGFVSG